MRCVAMTIRLFAIEQPNMRVLGSEILLESNGHSRGQGNYSVFLVFALANVDDHPLKVDVRYYKIDDFLSAQSGRINERKDYPVLKQCRCCKQHFQFLLVQDNRQLGVLL